MEFFSANMAKVTAAKLGGRDYLVAPLTLLVPGVLAGNQGPLLYPEDEVSNTPGNWNHTPIVVYHPTNPNGEHISARDPEVIDKSGIGLVFRDRYENDQRQAEGWFDVDRVKEVDKSLPPAARIYPRLRAGKTIELSTGLDLTKDPAPPGANHNGVPYSHIARNYKPDHLAILPDQEGACSNKDGCGVNVSTTNEGEPMNRNEMLTYLANNCECWKGKVGQKALASLPDDRLAKLVGNTKLVLIVNQVRNKKAGAANADDGDGGTGVDIAGLAEFLGITTDPASDPIGFVKELQSKLNDIQSKLGGAAEPTDAGADDTTTTMAADTAGADGDGPDEPVTMAADVQPAPAANRRKPAKPVTSQAWLASAPPEIRSAVTNAMAIEKNQKAAIVQRLVGNVQDDGKRQALGARLMTKSLSELQDLLAIMPVQEPAQAANSSLPNFAFAGAAGGPRSIVDNSDEREVLDIDSARAQWDRKETA